ncbi:MAG TPA: HEAT repeat domain-containing protein [Polyangia bacterium]|nr:HEAT repeat domain-containing protein [Polyangia bacterium]
MAGVSALLGSGAARSAVPPQEPPIAGEGVEADYLRALHVRIHPLWAGLFVREVAARQPESDPINDRARQVVMLFSVRWDGSPTDISVIRESGLPLFDRAARAAIVRVDHFPVPPAALFSDDHVAHFRWTLSRDDRLCSGGELQRFEEPLVEALPHLLIEGRVEEALWRLARRAAPQSTDGGEGMAESLALFARSWLSRPQPDPVTDGRAAAALARAGDSAQVPRLQQALGRRETVEGAAMALRALKVEICPFVEKQLADRDPVVRELALRALQGGGGRLPPTSPCVQVLSALVQDQTLDGRQRALAARAVAGTAADGARRLLGTLVGDPQPAVRAAAIALLARPGGGRPALYRGVTYLRDPEVEVRAAAAAALVRSCGDLALDQLVLVWKEPGPEVGVAVANELGRMTTPASEAFLVRLARRQNAEVRAAVAEALVARRALSVPGPGGKKPTAQAVAAAAAVAPAGAPPPEMTAALRAVSGLGRREAIAWVLANFGRLDPADLVDVFGSWLGPPVARENASVSAR